MADKLWKLTHRAAIRQLPRQYLKYYKKSQAPAERVHDPPPKCDYLDYKQDPETGYVYRQPDYPIDVIRTPESLEGLWAGEGFVKGFERPKRLNPRIARIWCPKLERHLFKSDILDIHIDVVVTPRTLELIDSNKGFDFYILNTRVQDLQSDLGRSLKHRMLVELAKPQEESKLSDYVKEKYRDYVIPLEEAEWFGLPEYKAISKYSRMRLENFYQPPLKQTYAKMMARGNQRELARQKALKKQSEQQKKKAADEKGSNKGLSLEERRRRDAEALRLKQQQKKDENQTSQ